MSDLDAFRTRVRDAVIRAVAGLPDIDPHDDGQLLLQERAWQQAMHDAGLAGPHWSAEWGAGLTLAEQVVLHEEVVRAGGPSGVHSFVGLNQTYGTLIAAGTEAQRTRFLPPILRGEELWCQGFSEPEAGSDLASLRTRAVRDGEDYVVSGQKIWSSGAAHADRCLLLVRTDPDVPKRKGLTLLLLDMRLPGVTVRPIPQPDGRSHFCEIFLDEVRVPVTETVGAENDGWRVAQATLSAERGPAVLELTERTSESMRRLITLARTVELAGRPAVEDVAVRERLMGLQARVDVFADLCGTVVTDMLTGRHGGTEGSIIKIFYSELAQDIARAGVELAPPVQHLRAEPGLGNAESGNWPLDYVASWIWMIGGGTNEIQRTVIGERILGLPREPAVGT